MNTHETNKPSCCCQKGMTTGQSYSEVCFTFVRMIAMFFSFGNDLEHFRALLVFRMFWHACAASDVFWQSGIVSGRFQDLLSYLGVLVLS